MTKSHTERSAFVARWLSAAPGTIAALLVTISAVSAQEPGSFTPGQPPAVEEQRVSGKPASLVTPPPGEGLQTVQPSPVAAAEAESNPQPSLQVPHDLSPWGMFMAADMVVKAVMLGLALASLATWTVWLAKGLELMGAKRRARRSVEALSEAGSLAQAREKVASGRIRRGPVAILLEAAFAEAKRSETLPPDGIKERASISLSRIEARAGRHMTRGTGVLATIGSTAPFVGLFGTVWGIMNSFIGISKAQTTNLAVVAPGIAEALLATAIGLVAAIPAVVIYNILARAIAGYRSLLSDASAEVMRHLSRDLDRRTPTVSPVVALQSTAALRARKAE
ncbi:tonB-system energizer ExbB [Microvirga roseola]|uniref:tonB-system energizer ExbB n=1 Tax=Microvirga roseola TaxID=2883126 RepID=UPI001E4EB098|nr:tonB-system energizer ExbB [Microvirga roseola]